MPTEAEFDEAVLRIDDCIEAIGDEIVDSLQLEEDPTRTVGFEAKSGGYTYRVRGGTNVDFFNVEFPYNIASNLAHIIEERDAEAILSKLHDGDRSLPPENSSEYNAAILVLESISENKRRDFTQYLIEILSAGSALYELHRTDRDAVAAFEVYGRVFPYEDAFCLAEFNRAVQSVINTGVSGIIFVTQSFDFDSIVEDMSYRPSPPVDYHIQ